MENLISFFEIPAKDFDRAVKFYEAVFGIKLQVYECEQEKMAFFPQENGKCPGAVSWTKGFNPSPDGILISLNCEEVDSILSLVEKNGGKTLIPKTKIEAEDRGYFSTFLDCEGNRLGLYSKK